MSDKYKSFLFNEHRKIPPIYNNVILYLSNIFHMSIMQKCRNIMKSKHHKKKNNVCIKVKHVYLCILYIDILSFTTFHRRALKYIYMFTIYYAH